MYVNVSSALSSLKANFCSSDGDLPTGREAQIIAAKVAPPYQLVTTRSQLFYHPVQGDMNSLSNHDLKFKLVLKQSRNILVVAEPRVITN